MNRRRIPLVGLLSCALFMACGGGIDGPSYEVEVTFVRSPLNVPLFDDMLRTSVCAGATLNPVPTAATAIRVLDAGGAFQPGAATINEQGNGSFLACLPLQSGLGVGVHSGALTLQICKDAACSQLYSLSQSTLPYAITVYHATSGLPPISASILVDGVAPANVNEGLAGDVRTYRIPARVGQSIQVTPSSPFVLVSVTSASLAPGSYPVGTVSVTARLPVGASAAVGRVGGRDADGRTVEVTVDVGP